MIIIRIWLFLFMTFLLSLPVKSGNISTADSTNPETHKIDYIGNEVKFYVNTFIGLSNPIAGAGFEIVVDDFLPGFSFNYELSYLFGLDFFKLDNSSKTSQFYGSGLSNRFSGGYCVFQWKGFAENRLIGPKPEKPTSNITGWDEPKKVTTGLGYDALKRLILKLDFLISPAFGSSLEATECKCWRQGYDTYFIPKLRYETIGKEYNPHDIFDLGFFFNNELDKYGWYFEYTNSYKALEDNIFVMRFQIGVLYYKNAKIFVENDGCCNRNLPDYETENNLIKKPTNPTLLLKLLFGVTI